jgi:hypothetical protein
MVMVLLFRLRTDNKTLSRRLVKSAGIQEKPVRDTQPEP